MVISRKQPKGPKPMTTDPLFPSYFFTVEQGTKRPKLFYGLSLPRIFDQTSIKNIISMLMEIPAFIDLGEPYGRCVWNDAPVWKNRNFFIELMNRTRKIPDRRVWKAKYADVRFHFLRRTISSCWEMPSPRNFRIQLWRETLGLVNSWDPKVPSCVKKCWSGVIPRKWSVYCDLNLQRYISMRARVLNGSWIENSVLPVIPVESSKSETC